jgi:hypothetical protein
MKPEIITREAKTEDYSSFKKMEEKAWRDTGIDIISEEMFQVWLKVFPEGLRLAIVDGEVCGHIYGQICDFDPFDKNDNRDLNSMTDNMYTVRTHNPAGNCIYSFSVSSTYPGAGVELNNYFIWLTKKMFKQYYAGAIRMPGLSRFAVKRGIKKLTKRDVTEYAELVRDTVRKKRKGNKKIFDPVVTPLLKVEGSDFARVIENFFPFKGTQSWGCLLYWENSNFSKKSIPL